MNANPSQNSSRPMIIIDNPSLASCNHRLALSLVFSQSSSPSTVLVSSFYLFIFTRQTGKPSKRDYFVNLFVSP